MTTTSNAPYPTARRAASRALFAELRNKFIWLAEILGIGMLTRMRRRSWQARDREKILLALGKALDVPADPNSVIARIRWIYGHLAQGITGTFPPMLLDGDPYMGSFTPRTWTTYFRARLEQLARSARIGRRMLLGRGIRFATDPGALTIAEGAWPPGANEFMGPSAPNDDSPLFIFLREK